MHCCPASCSDPACLRPHRCPLHTSPPPAPHASSPPYTLPAAAAAAAPCTTRDGALPQRLQWPRLVQRRQPVRLLFGLDGHGLQPAVVPIVPHLRQPASLLPRRRLRLLRRRCRRRCRSRCRRRVPRCRRRPHAPGDVGCLGRRHWRRSRQRRWCGRVVSRQRVHGHALLTALGV